MPRCSGQQPLRRTSRGAERDELDGEPEETEGLLVWRLQPVEVKEQTAEEAAAEEAARRERRSAGGGDGGGTVGEVPKKKVAGCDEPQRFFTDLVQSPAGEKAAKRAEAAACGAAMAEVCRKRLRNPGSSGAVLEEAVTLLAMFEDPDDAALIEKTWAMIGPQ